MIDAPARPAAIASRARLVMTRGWPLFVSTVALLVAAVGEATSTLDVPTPLREPALLVLAISALTCGFIVLSKARGVGGSEAVIAGAAAAAALIGIGWTAIDPAQTELPAFLVGAPWRYALTPIAVHLAFAIGWPHRHRYWFGVVLGWYLLHLAMWTAVAGGIAAGEDPLVRALDGTFRRQILEPTGLAVAIAALGIASVSPARRFSERRASLWALAAVALGVGPQFLVGRIAGLDTLGLEGLRAVDLAMTALPLLSVVALLSLPFIDAGARDTRGLALGQRVLDEPNPSVALQMVAREVQSLFDAEGVSVRLVEPAVHAAVGRVRPVDHAQSLTADAETQDDRRVLVAPIGRSSDPLGEVRLEAAHSGAYGRREREWLVAFLVPVSTALRARRRENTLENRGREVSKVVAVAAAEMLAAARTLPAPPVDDGMAVPPPVDAGEVLGQLGDGISSISRRGEALEDRSSIARERARSASDRIAQSLDSLRSAATSIRQLSTHGEEIDLSNQVISGVAFRTNLLANNAALEATRAGTAGRTFGVLAEEIRRLADATAATSEAIADRTSALSGGVSVLAAALESIVDALSEAIRETEAGEDAARQLGVAAAELESATRSLRPALDEAYAVAQRRSARDHHLTGTLERFLADRSVLARALTTHRDTLDKLGSSLDRIAQSGATRRVGSSS